MCDVGVVMCDVVGRLVTVNAWRSEDSLMELVLSSHLYVDSGDTTLQMASAFAHGAIPLAP